MSIFSRLKSAVSARTTRQPTAPDLPLEGYAPLRRGMSEIDRWDNDQLARLDQLLPWNCFTVDTKGRRVGAPAWVSKRVTPQDIPDARISRLHQLVDLSGRSVLEVGCFEGVHTIALCDVAAQVTAVDSRVDNVVKTVVRTALYGHRPTVRLLDVERPGELSELRSDVLHHCGVLYHLKDPVGHLREVLPLTGHAALIDTHYAADDDATSTYSSDGEEFRVKDFAESGVDVPFAGMYDMARWLRLDDLIGELARAGFGDVLVCEKRQERNGLRVHIVARRPTEL